MKIIICLEKFSDWLEAYSIFVEWPDAEEVKIIYIENDRNNKKAVESLFREFFIGKHFEYLSCTDKNTFFRNCHECLQDLNEGDILAAPFVRYRDIWKVVPLARKKSVITVHLSESLPDSFGRLGYRLGYRLGFRLVGGFHLMGLLKQLCIIPFAYFYANTHKPDYCFYNMYPKVNNVFVRITKKAHLPSVDERKKRFILEKTNGEKRPLLISGFGYDLQKMVKVLNMDKYIATSKNKEIIIDGIPYPLEEYICAEEVLLSDCVDSIIGYNSTAICWAYLMGIKHIECFEASALSHQYGFLNGYLTRKTLKKCGIELKQEHSEMVTK